MTTGAFGLDHVDIIFLYRNLSGGASAFDILVYSHAFRCIIYD